MTIFQSVLNPLLSQLSALVSLNPLRGSLLVSLNLPRKKWHGPFQQSWAVPFMRSSQLFLMALHSRAPTGNASPSKWTDYFTKQDSRNSSSSRPGLLLWNHFPNLMNQAFFAPWIRVFSMSLRPINQGILTFITPHLSLLHHWAFFSLYLHFLNKLRSGSFYKF